MAIKNSLNNTSSVFDVTSGLTNTTGTVTLNSGTSVSSYSTDAAATVVNLATGGAAKSVTLGSIDSSSSLDLQFGTGNFTLASATGTIMSVLNTGEITYPLQPAFLGQLETDDLNVTGAGASYTLGGPTALVERFDQGGDFSGATFTAPVTGKYKLKSNIRFIQVEANMTDAVYTLNTSNRAYRTGYVSAGASLSSVAQFGLNIIAFADMDNGDTATISAVISNGTGNTSDADGTTPGAVSMFGGSLKC